MVFDPDYWSVFTLNVPSHVQIIVWEDPLLESYITNSRGVKGKSSCEHKGTTIIKGIDIFSALQHNAFIHHIIFQ